MKKSGFLAVTPLLFLGLLTSLVVLPLAIFQLTSSTQLKTLGESTSNILANPGFEEGSGAWKNFSSGVSITSQFARSGSKSLSFSTSSSQTYEVYQDVAVQGGTTYTATSYLSMEVSGNGITVSLVWMNDGNSIKTDTVGTMTGVKGGWSQVSGTFTAPSNANKVRFRFFVDKDPNNDGLVLVDDSELVGAGSAPPPPPTEEKTTPTPPPPPPVNPPPPPAATIKPPPPPPPPSPQKVSPSPPTETSPAPAPSPTSGGIESENIFRVIVDTITGLVDAVIDSVVDIVGNIIPISSPPPPAPTPAPPPTVGPPHLLPSLLPTTTVSLPPCASHNPEVYHALIDPAGKCHYDHEHHDDPNWVNADLEAPGAWFGQTGRSVGFPWQKAPVDAIDALRKHNGLKWSVRTAGKPTGNASFATGFIHTFRLQAHTLATASDAVDRFHGFTLEAVGESSGKRGIIRAGGRFDFGCLGDLSSGEHLPLPGDPATCDFNGPQRLHAIVPGPSTLLTWANWLGVTQGPVGRVFFYIIGTFGPIDKSNPSNQLYNCPGLTCNTDNGSQVSVATLEFTIGDPRFDPDNDGIANFNGFTDRDGNISATCTTVSSTCVPLIIENLPMGFYDYSDGGIGQADGFRYDTSPAGQFWIGFPN